MSKTIRVFWLDIALYLLLGMSIALVNLTPSTPTGSHPGLAWHAHAAIGMLLTLGSVVHIIWHRQWFYAVLTGKAKGKSKMFMVIVVTIFMILANISGHMTVHSEAAASMHRFTGSIALIGLLLHGVKHIHWMVMTAKRLIMTGGRRESTQSA